MKEYERIEEEMIAAKPDSSVPAEYFAVSFTATGITLTVPLGMDIRFCRGVDIALGLSADKRTTVTLIANERSSYRLGQVHRTDSLLGIPTRSVQIPYEKTLRPSYPMLAVAPMRRTRPSKVFLPRTGDLQLTL